MEESKFDVSISIIGLVGFFYSVLSYMIIPERPEMFIYLMLISISFVALASYRMTINSKEIYLVEKSKLVFSFFMMSILFLFLSGIYISYLYGNYYPVIAFTLFAYFLSDPAYLAYVGKRFMGRNKKFNPVPFGYWFGISLILGPIVPLVLLYSVEIIILSILIIISGLFALLGGAFSPKKQEIKAMSDRLRERINNLQTVIPEFEQKMKKYEEIKLDIKYKEEYLSAMQKSAVQTQDVQKYFKLQFKELKKLKKKQSALEKYIKKSNKY